MKKNIFLLFAFSFLSGCSVIPNPGEPPQRFTLQSLPLQTPHKRIKHTLIIEQPNTYPPLDNQRIAVVPQDNRIDYYANCEWADRLGILVQDSLVSSLQNQGLFSGITRSYEGMAPDLLLKADIRKFFVTQHPKATAFVQYYVQLIQLSDRQVVAQQTFESSLPLAQENLNEISFKLNEAHRQTLQKIIEWLSSKFS